MSRRKISGILISLLVTAPFIIGGSPARDIVETAKEAGTFETLMVACEAAGLLDELKAEGPFTVFAPSDAAFERLPTGTLERLLRPENYLQLREILTYHIVPSRISTDDAATVLRAASLQGRDLRFWFRGEEVMVGNAAVTTGDIACSNGTIHVIDRVLMPPHMSPKGQVTAD